MSYGQQGGYGSQQGGYGGHGGYGPQHGMPYGANERGHGWGQGGGYEGVQAQRGGHGGHGGQYGELLYSPEFADAVMRVCRERMDEVLAEQGYFPAGMQGAGFGGQGGYDHERHRRFKEALEELRDLPTAEAQRRMPVMFPGMDEEEKRVLSVLVSESSKKKLAQKANMQPEKFMHVKHALEEKLR